MEVILLPAKFYHYSSVFHRAKILSFEITCTIITEKSHGAEILSKSNQCCGASPFLVSSGSGLILQALGPAPDSA